MRHTTNYNQKKALVLDTIYRGHIDDDPRGEVLGQVIYDVFAPPWKTYPKMPMSVEALDEVIIYIEKQEQK